MQLSRKQKTCSDFFSAFLKSIWDFKYFQKKDDFYSRDISEITGFKKRD